MQEAIKTIQNQLRNRLILNEDNVIHVEERKQVYDLLNRTLQVGESNSALLIGPHGVGKTNLINNVLSELKTTPNFDNDCVIVKLHGLIHTDDKLALVTITSQMQLENVVGEKVFGSFAENLAFLLACLKTGNHQTSKSVIFVIEEFDLFCAHTNQTLLYNLFDISQSAQAPICVLGITCRLDVIELLEKRVKSRFSHRQIFLFPKNDSLESYMDRIKGYLLINSTKCINQTTTDEWNKSITNLLKDKNTLTLFQRLMDITLNQNDIKKFLLNAIFKVDEKRPKVTFKHLEEVLKEQEKDDIIIQILDLSVLELCLLISMKHHLEIYDNQPMNFEMIYARYVKFANASSHVQTVQRPIVMKAFEHLIHVEFLQLITRGQKEYEMYKLLVSKHQIMDAVKQWPGLPTDVSQWAISSLL